MILRYFKHRPPVVLIAYVVDDYGNVQFVHTNSAAWYFVGVYRAFGGSK